MTNRLFFVHSFLTTNLLLKQKPIAFIKNLGLQTIVGQSLVCTGHFILRKLSIKKLN